MTVFLLTAQAAPAAEPSPGGWAATGEKIVGLAHSQPDAFWPVVAVALPLVLLVGIGILIVRWVIPAWRAEKQLDRDSLVAALRQRGEEAERDAAKDREVAKAQNEAIVQRVESKVDRITGELAKVGERVERHSEVLARLAAKAAVGLALICAFLSGLAAGAGAFAIADRPAAVMPTLAPACFTPASAQSDDTAAHDCPKGCPTDFVCCGKEKCCPAKSRTAAMSSPLSAATFASIDNYAAVLCVPGFDNCGN